MLFDTTLLEKIYVWLCFLIINLFVALNSFSPSFGLDNCVFVSDIDECSSSVNLCANNAVCTNTYGHYECKCANGFTGNVVKQSLNCSGKYKRNTH